MMTFERIFEALTGKAPFPWQRALFDKEKAKAVVKGEGDTKTKGKKYV